MTACQADSRILGSVENLVEKASREAATNGRVLESRFVLAGVGIRDARRSAKVGCQDLFLDSLTEAEWHLSKAVVQTDDDDVLVPARDALQLIYASLERDHA